MTDRAAAARVMASLRRTPIGDSAVLVGSSSLLGFATEVPALTEDIDVCVPVAIVESSGDAIVAALEGEGYAHERGTATFVSADGVTFDLLGHGDPAVGDRVAGHGALRVMVFEDLCAVLSHPWTVEAAEGGGRVLTPAAFVLTKLLTERAHKGTKDKLQALLVIAEHRSDRRFERQARDLLGRVDGVRLEDVRASALDAFIALGRDPQFSDAGAEGYKLHLEAARVGLERLMGWLDAG